VASARATSRSLIPAALAVSLGAALAATVALRASFDGERAPIIGLAAATGALSVIVLAGAVASDRSNAIGWGIGLLAIEYATSVLGEGVASTWLRH